ncbi:hypothetical protein O181_109401 [Austropuccinia psidii MF-1]|uniref:Uncharacterized protein n=1 Tax=Austropuccinia psidii MF-1 TaxID=1389203 RepID=A0A9Q3JWP1_9BASI|nr:hypothetical protein [Austropuccinia psidii MF-1]
MSQFAELQERHERMKTLTSSMEIFFKTLQEDHAQSGKPSEEINRKLNQVFDEQHHFKRDRNYYYSNKSPNAKKKVFAIDKVPEEECSTEYSDSHSMGDAIRESPDDDHDPKEEFLQEYQEEKQLEIKDIQLEAGIPQDTANKNLSKHTQDEHKFLVIPTRGMAYIHETATKMTVCVDNAQQPLIINSGAHCSIVTRGYLDNHFPNWEKQVLPTKAKNFKSA